ncbi:MAG: Glutamate synthase [NADPH] small chain [Ignavibacteriae bacterium]|nr:MAG: Glutamate synthase [NADPH] small chain [Ignavibacteriota bacterium]
MQNIYNITHKELKLGIKNFEYKDLYLPHKLEELTNIFYKEIESKDSELYQNFLNYKNNPDSFSPVQVSNILISMAKQLSEFVGKLFGVQSELNSLKSYIEEDIIYLKKEFIQRRALKKWNQQSLSNLKFQDIENFLIQLKSKVFYDLDSTDEEKLFAQIVLKIIEIEKNYRAKLTSSENVIPEDIQKYASRLVDLFNHQDNLANPETVVTTAKNSLEKLEQWCAFVYIEKSLKERIKKWSSFHLPEDIDYNHLVHHKKTKDDGLDIMHGIEFRRRDGFDLTDPRFNKRDVAVEVDYCIFCHERNKDSCSKGLYEKTGVVKLNPLGIELKGCPLDEKISEAHYLKRRGNSLGALALIMIDNPMAPGTGHRICNDCMKSCIYQKQTPVNIPQIETGILTDVLNIPWGFEIYSLLTRWNPINIRQPFAKPYNGHKILIVGMGPAGYTLAHYLLNEGFGVVGIDGLKIEPLPEELTGNENKPPIPIYDINELRRPLDERIMAGFGGVSEYGITVRWDKNFLTIIYLNLLRRKNFKIFGGIRFGGTLTIEDAWALGFDHIAIATGAGKPTILNMKNNLLRGIRKASDFLMALQLTGAAKKSSLANLQIELPAIVIGGGLTAIDAATELMAYYPYQVEKIYERYEQLIKKFGEEEIIRLFDEEEKQIFRRFLEHGKEVKAERIRAQENNEKPDFIKLVKKWGGVKVCYRKGLTDSPAYRLNHEEIIKAFEEGMEFIEKLNPVEAVPDDFGAIKEVIFEKQIEENGKWKGTGEYVTLPARTMLVAAGTSPNIIYEREFPNTFKLDKWKQFFQTHHLTLDGDAALLPAEDSEKAFFTSYRDGDKFITYYGDNHPAYAGNVVKAMASARNGYPHVLKLFEKKLVSLDKNLQPERDKEWQKYLKMLEDLLSPQVVSVNRLTPTIVEVIVKAPLQAKKFRPGQFYRVQNYEADSIWIGDTQLTMEGLALTGAWTDPEKGLLSVIVLEMGASSRLCAALKPGQRVVVMGPTGTPTEIPKGENVLLAGGGLGNAVLFSIAKALRENGNKVIYFAGYKRGEDLFKREEIEASTDQIIWSTDSGAEIKPNRPQDAHYRGNIVQAMKAYAEGKLTEVLIPLPSVNRIIAIGSDRMMAAVKEARHTVLAPYFSNHIAIGSINAPMQCMMKEVCAQCLIRHIDPVTGEESKPVFTCFNQDQHLDEVDFNNLNSRLKSNSVLEKIANKFLDYLLATQPIEKV